MKQTIKISELAEFGSRTYFAEALGINKITLLRAERKGLLQSAGNTRREIYYTREQIKKYLGIE